MSVPLLINGILHRSRSASESDDGQGGVRGREKEQPLNLSGGQQQRIAIARVGA
ncbi:MAG: hypothetical protein R3F23_08460 [Verrucomicrobiia bacterium]